jgi:hypothetical protein
VSTSLAAVIGILEASRDDDSAAISPTFADSLQILNAAADRVVRELRSIRPLCGRAPIFLLPIGVISMALAPHYRLGLEYRSRTVGTVCAYSSSRLNKTRQTSLAVLSARVDSGILIAHAMWWPRDATPTDGFESVTGKPGCGMGPLPGYAGAGAWTNTHPKGSNRV